MGVAVLYPQDCLREGVSHHRRLISPPRSKPRRISGSRNPSTAQTRSGPKKQWSPSRSPPPPQSKAKDEVKVVRILKRGEDLPPTQISTPVTTPVKNNKTRRERSVDRANSDPITLSTYRKSPERVPAPIPIQSLFVDGFYAGSAFSTSPPPSSLPLPGFCTKGNGSGASLKESDVVALDLRRILKIE